jgi:hypothetical protein
MKMAGSFTKYFTSKKAKQRAENTSVKFFFYDKCGVKYCNRKLLPYRYKNKAA